MGQGHANSHADTPAYLVIDQGGHASRALLFSLRGELLAKAEVPIGVRRDGECVEHDPVELVASIRGAITQVLRETDPALPLTAGLCTQRSSIVCWDRATGAPLTPVLSWQDRRAAEFIDACADRHADIHARTGLVPNAHYGASKLRWCLDALSNTTHTPPATSPHTLARVDAGAFCAGPLAAYLVARLTGQQPCVDPANAQRTLLYKLADGDWDETLLALFGVPRASLPAVVPSRHDYGAIPVPGGRIPLSMLCGDQPAALFAQGKPVSDIAYINVGTGAFVQRIIAEPVQHARLLTSVVADLDGSCWYALEGTVNGAGSALAWYAERCDRDVDALLAEAAPALAQCDKPPLFLNGVSGLGSPYWHPLDSRFIGAGEGQARTVAILESVVFLLQVNLEHMRTVLPAPTAIQISGGLTRLDGLCQRLADLAGLPVRRAQDHEASARGVAWLLAGCPADWSPVDGVLFTPHDNPDLHSRFQQWRTHSEAALEHEAATS